MIQLDDISWSTKGFSLNQISFTIPAATYAVLMGRTGSGKTSLLEILCGLRMPISGDIFIGSRKVTCLEPALRRIGYVPQDGALFPTLTVREHLAFAPQLQRKPPDAIHQIVCSLAQQLGIEHLLDRLPAGLSGGERQRVALGRALAADPEVLALDEPLSALDDETRESLLPILKSLTHDKGITVLHITHHRSEALALADMLLELKDGKVSSSPIVST